MLRGVTESHETALTSAIKELEYMAPESEAGQVPEIHRTASPEHHDLAVFISHSSRDAELALALIELLKAGLGLLANQ